VKERDIQKQIMDYLRAHQVFCMRVNTGLCVLGDKKKRVVRFTNLGPGCADLLVLHRKDDLNWKPPLWVETKSDKGQQSVAQAGFETTVKQLGHEYVVARSIDDLEGMI
jgi:hypothetical protein